MKKFLIAIVALMTSISFANAERFSMGVTVKGGVFEADGASEIFSGDHAGNRSSTKVTKSTASEGEDAEAAYAMGSIFLEAALTDRVSLGHETYLHFKEGFLLKIWNILTTIERARTICIFIKWRLYRI